MKMHEIPKIGLDLNQTSSGLNAPINQNIDFQRLGNDLNQVVDTPPPANNIPKPIPWKKVLLWGGAIAGGIFLFREIWKNRNYISNGRKRRM